MEYREFTDSELKWIRSFERVMKKAPKSLFMFVGAGINIHPLDYDNNRYMKGDSVDNLSPIIGITTPMNCDGGDY